MATVLVVDDSEIVRDAVARTLRHMGHTPIKADDGLAAQGVLQSSKVDFVISDLYMPIMTGVQLFRWVRENKPELLTRFVFLTADPKDLDVYEDVKHITRFEKPVMNLSEKLAALI